MYKIIAQPINLRYIKDKVLCQEELSEESKLILKICEFGLKHGYKLAA